MAAEYGGSCGRDGGRRLDATAGHGPRGAASRAPAGGCVRDAASMSARGNEASRFVSARSRTGRLRCSAASRAARRSARPAAARNLMSSTAPLKSHAGIELVARLVVVGAVVGFLLLLQLRSVRAEELARLADRQRRHAGLGKRESDPSGRSSRARDAGRRRACGRAPSPALPPSAPASTDRRRAARCRSSVRDS